MLETLSKYQSKRVKNRTNNEKSDPKSGSLGYSDMLIYASCCHVPADEVQGDLDSH
jgi:hypothetical protein